MSSHASVATFTVVPLVALLVSTVASVLRVRRLGEYRLLLLVAILLLMGQHQALEGVRFLSGGPAAGGVGEVVETGANLLTAVAVYYGLGYAERQRDLADELEASQQRYRTLTERSPLPIVVVGDGEVLYANESASDLFGAADPDDLVGRPASDLVHPDHEAAFDELVDAITTDEGTVRTAEQRWVDLDGDDREVVVSGGCARYGDRRAVHLVFRDVTREREYQRGYERVQSQFQSTLESSNDAILLFDPDDEEIRKANPRASELLGYDREELVGMSPLEIHPHEVAEFEQFVADVRTQEGLRTDELSCLTSDGKRIPAEVSASRVEVGGDECVLASIRDVSDRKRREHQLAVLQRIMRHNIRNDMAVVGGYAETIADLSDDETVLSATEKIREHADRLTSLSAGVQQLRSVIENGDERAVAVAPVVEDVVAPFREAYPDATFETDVPEDLQVQSVGGLDWAIEELVENAVEHNDSGTPWVRIGAERDQQVGSHPFVSIRVEDDGPGISEGERAASNVDVEATAVKHGSGFGLHAVGQIAELSGGEIRIDDHPETGGAVVTVTLPVPGSDRDHPTDEVSTGSAQRG